MATPNNLRDWQHELGITDLILQFLQGGSRGFSCRLNSKNNGGGQEAT